MDTCPVSRTPYTALLPCNRYVGNGLVGVRVQSEEGGVGVLHVLLDNVMLGAQSKRQPTGYFRLTVADPTGGPYQVSLNVRLLVRDSLSLGFTHRRLHLAQTTHR